MVLTKDNQIYQRKGIKNPETEAHGEGQLIQNKGTSTTQWGNDSLQ